MSMKKAIQKLREEILMKEMTVEAIENFNDIEICDQLKAIKESDLRYDKEFRENWVKGILNYKGFEKVESNSNGLTVFYPKHSLFIPTHNYDGVIIEETLKIKEPIIPDDRNKKLLEARLAAAENYKNIPSLKNFKKVLELGTTRSTALLWLWNKVGAMQLVNNIYVETRSALLDIENGWKKYKDTLETNSKIRAERERIDRELADDFKMFEQNGLKVYKRY